jgi:streptogramin lyase
MLASKERLRVFLFLCALGPLISTFALALQRENAPQPQLTTRAPSPGGALEFAGEWGVKGQGPGKLSDPVAMAADVNDRIYIADRASGLLQKFDAAGFPLFSYEDATMRATSALAIDSGGAIYVADAAGGRIWIHWPEGQLLRNFRIPAERAAKGAFGFCVTADGTIVVPDTAGARVQAFSPGGQLKIAWKIPPASSNQSAPISVSSSGFDDFVYVADAASGRIYIFTNRGEQQAAWEPPSDASGPLRAIGVSKSHVYALRGGKPQLEIWTPDGKRAGVDALSSLVSASPKPLSLAVTPDDQVFILDAATTRVLRWRLRQ